MSVTDADRIAAAGIPLTLGGREVRVRYTLRSWKEAEDRFGSLEEVIAILRRLLAGEEKKEIGTIVPLLWAGLVHEGLSLDDVYELGDIHQRGAYASAVLAAIGEGSPGPGPGKDEAVVDSPGATTTTPQPSATAAATPSSGA